MKHTAAVITVSDKGARENILAVMDPLMHGLDMLASAGSADCAQEAKP